jgi:hypothetical protein
VIDNQFYPTPKSLARKAYEKFEEREIRRLLEPQAGRGDMLDALFDSGLHRRRPEIDCIEIDLQNQAILRDKGYRVIDADFLSYSGRGAMYSHILMNPPFSRGVDHTLKAWSILYSGEVVSIVNAASIENPSSKAAELLVKLIADHGSVETLDQQFITKDTQRKTSVRIALIHLKKEPADPGEFFIPFEDLQTEQAVEQPEEVNKQQLALPASTIKNLVRAFNVAVDKIRIANFAEDTANYYCKMIFTQIRSEDRPVGSGDLIETDSFNKRYMKLKDSAWRAVMNTTEFTKRLSSKAQKRLEEEFTKVRDLEFTEANIYGLLAGLVAQKTQIDMEMVSDVFDMISKYHTENRAYYMGWKSNDKHRAGAFRIKMSRFILPIGGAEWGIRWENKREILDIDKVFAMMDGKHEPSATGSMFHMLDSRVNELKTAGRFQTDYFDIRYYKGIGTLHIFPRRKDLVDRMNRIVGRMRQWLPDESETVDQAYWDIYDNAEKITTAMEKIAEKNMRFSWSRNLFWEADQGNIDMDEIHAKACESLGINRPDRIAHQPSNTPAIGH